MNSIFILVLEAKMQTVCDLQTDKQIEYIIQTAAKPLPREGKARKDEVMVSMKRICFFFVVRWQNTNVLRPTDGQTDRIHNRNSSLIVT